VAPRFTFGRFDSHRNSKSVRKPPCRASQPTKISETLNPSTLIFLQSGMSRERQHGRDDIGGEMATSMEPNSRDDTVFAQTKNPRADGAIPTPSSELSKDNIPDRCEVPSYLKNLAEYNAAVSIPPSMNPPTLPNRKRHGHQTSNRQEGIQHTLPCKCKS
jgi:hypothetical protein